MNKNILFYLLTGITILLSACSDNVPEVTSTWKIEASFNVVDPEFWPTGQEVRLGVFDSNNLQIPVQSVALASSAGSLVDAVLPKVEEGSYTLMLYLVEGSIFKSILKDLGTVNVNQDLIMESEEITFLTFERVQSQVFNSCITCHGGSSGEPAANLSLLENHSYANLVNVAAKNNAAMMLVKPEDAGNSFLVKVLNKDVNFDHRASTGATPADKQLIVDWINNGALNN